MLHLLRCLLICILRVGAIFLGTDGKRSIDEIEANYAGEVRLFSGEAANVKQFDAYFLLETVNGLTVSRAKAFFNSFVRVHLVFD